MKEEPVWIQEILEKYPVVTVKKEKKICRSSYKMQEGIEKTGSSL